MPQLYRIRRTEEILLELSSHKLKIIDYPEMEMVVLYKSQQSEIMTISRHALSQIADIITS